MYNDDTRGSCARSALQAAVERPNRNFLILAFLPRTRLQFSNF